MRGYQKKVIYVKNPGSAVFEEAYFVLSEKEMGKGDVDIIGEANRIIEENTERGEKRISVRSILKNGALFAAGFFSAVIIILAFTLI
jgi:hypothetical protein